MAIDYSFMTGLLQPQGGIPGTVTPPPVHPGANIGPLANIPGEDITSKNVSGIAGALASGAPDPVATANQTAGGFMDKVGGQPGLSFMLASLGSALSAKDPSSWQHQLSNTMQKGSQQQLQQRGMLIAALQQKMGAKPGLKASALTRAKSKYNLETPKLQTLPSLSPLAESLSGGV